MNVNFNADFTLSCAIVIMGGFTAVIQGFNDEKVSERVKAFFKGIIIALAVSSMVLGMVGAFRSQISTEKFQNAVTAGIAHTQSGIETVVTNTKSVPGIAQTVNAIASSQLTREEAHAYLDALYDHKERKPDDLSNRSTDDLVKLGNVAEGQMERFYEDWFVKDEHITKSADEKIYGAIPRPTESEVGAIYKQRDSDLEDLKSFMLTQTKETMAFVSALRDVLLTRMTPLQRANHTKSGAVFAKLKTGNYSLRDVRDATDELARIIKEF